MKWSISLPVFCVMALMSVGMVSLYSVSPAYDSTRYLSRQVIAAGIGVAGAFLVVAVGYHRLRSVAWLFFAGAVLLLVLVLVTGVKVNGARRWFRFAGFQFQPSDFAKLALLVALAHYGAYYQRLMPSLRRGVLAPALLVGVVVGLIFLEPDWGTALLLSAVSWLVLVVAGARWRYLVPPLVLGVGAVALLLALNPMRSERVYSWLHLEETRQGVGYQAWQAKLALGAGGPVGVGLNHSRQKIYLPEYQTDFIFAVIGEEFGYAGTLGVGALFVTLFVCGMQIARQATDTFGRLLATGISFLIALQALINMGVVSSALPNKGLALPFISYGGSNLLMMLIATGVLISIARSVPDPGAGESPEPMLNPPAPP